MLVLAQKHLVMHWRGKPVGSQMKPVAVAIFCKTPSPGQSKTRLSPPLNPDECSQLSACFIRDLSMTIAQSTADGFGTPFAVYTPAGSEAALRTLLPEAFNLHLQGDEDFGSRLLQATPRDRRFRLGPS